MCAAWAPTCCTSTPSILAYTNHKYDALDYLQLSPEFGTMDDFRALADATHAHGMKLVLDGVFNHMGRNAPRFQRAMAAYEAEGTPTGGGREAAGGPDDRDWFAFGAAVSRAAPAPGG
jgi:glycosidase